MATDGSEERCGPRRFPEATFVCDRQAVRRGGCILHAPKLTPEEKERLSPEERKAEELFENEFRATLAALIEERIRNRQRGFGAIRFAHVPWKEPPFRQAIDNAWEFAGCIFDQGFDLSSSSIKNGLFRHAVFRGRTSLNFADLQDLTFIGARFEGPADFAGARFRGFNNFAATVFESELWFRWAKIYDGHVWFRGEPPDHCFKGPCDFYRLEIQPGGKLSFEHVNLGKASFTYVDLERPLFLDVNWYKPAGGLIRRGPSLWDEFRPRGPRDDIDGSRRLVAASYRQLVLSYERRRDYETAESFHVGEMEARRKELGSDRLAGRLSRAFNFYNAYRLMSNYGTGIWQALLVLVAIIAASSMLFLFAGFRPVDSTHVIRYVPALRVPPLAVLWDFGRAFLLTLSIATMQRDRPYEPVGDWSHALGSLALLLIASQAALVLLAVRRRFRR